MLLSTPFLGFVNQLPIRGKKKKGSQLQDSAFLPCIFFPAGELYSIGKMDPMNTKPEEIPKAEFLEMSVLGSRQLGGRMWYQLTPLPLGPPAGLSNPA